MRTSDNKVPIGTKVVSEEEFKRLAQENMAKDGEPMVEKTIFIVKPIYVNVDDLKAPKKQSKHKVRKQIYSEKMRPPQLMQQPAPGK